MKTNRITSLLLLFLVFIVVAPRAGASPEGMKAMNSKKEYPVSGIRGVDITIACELHIRQSDQESLTIEANEDIFDKIDVEIKDSILYIESDRQNRDFDNWDIEVYLTVKSLRLIDIGGAVKLETRGTLRIPRLELDISGAADLDMHIETEKLLADFSGAVNTELEGKANYVVMEMSGASNVEAYHLVTDAFYLDFSGFGKADIYVQKVLKVDMSGMGIVKYGGDPKKIDASSSGLGIVKAR